MTMPKWHETMRPVLEALAKSDGCLTGSNLQEAVATTFDMTGDERAERLKSGQLRFYNRVYWGITDLEKAKLLEYGEKKGTYRITGAGRSYLTDFPAPSRQRRSTTVVQLSGPGRTASTISSDAKRKA